MVGLLYYLPQQTRGITLADIKAAELGYAFEERFTPCEVRGGPDKSGGVIVADDRGVPGHQIGYYPDQQEWRKIPGIEAWVGCYREAHPTPADLARTRMLNGHLVRLGDNQDWLIPVARGQIETDNQELRWYVALPEVIGIDDAGNWEPGAVLPQYAELWEIANRWWNIQGEATAEKEADETAESVTVRFDFAGVNDAALSALATNYRMGKAEVVLLGLFNRRCLYDILNALVDIPTIEEFLKKKEEVDGSPTADGLPDLTPATAPP